MINPGVLAPIRVVGVRGDPCGARKPTTRIGATTPGLIIRILNSVFFKFLKVLNYSVNLTRYSPTP